MRRVAPALVLACLAAVAIAAAAAAGPFPPGTNDAKERTAWRAILHWPAGCELKWQDAHPDTAGVDTWQPRSTKRLVAVICFAGAYQSTAVLYLVDAQRHKVGPIPFDIYIDPGSGKPTVTRETEILGNLIFTPRTGLLEVFDKARGPGDCGIYSVFRLSSDRFVPVEARAKLACDGKPPYDPRRWPKLPLPKDSSTAQTPIRVVGLTEIGSFKVEGGTPATARRAFGKATKITDHDQSCLYTWPGITIDFYTLLHQEQCRDWSAYSNATITRPWITDRGLRQGDTVDKAKRLYPDARRAGRNLGVTGGLGLIVKTFAAIGDYGLAVHVKAGRVTNLFLFYPQGGE